MSDIWDNYVTVMTGATTTGLVQTTLGTNHAFEIPAGMTGTISNKPLEYITIKWILPESATPRSDSLYWGWTWDEDTRTVSRTIANPPVYNGADNWWDRGTRYPLNIDFNNAPLNQVLELKAQLSYKHSGAQEQTIPELTTKIRFKPSYFNPWATMEMDKDNYNGSGTDRTGETYNNAEGAYTITDGRIYDRTADKTDTGLTYIVTIKQRNNGSSPTDITGGLTSKLLSIEDRLLKDNSHRIYYKNFQITGFNKTNSAVSNEVFELHKQEIIDTINSGNVLYGIDDAGVKHEIARNVQYGQRVDINDTAMQYSKLSLEFDTPIRMDNIEFYYYLRTEPAQSELDKFADGTYTTKQTYPGDLSIQYIQSSTIGTEPSSTPVYTARDTSNWGNTSLELIRPLAYIEANGNRTVPYSASGTYFDYATRGYTSASHGLWGAMGLQDLENLKLIQLLPQGFEYGGTKRVDNYSPTAAVTGPEVIDNFRGTGRQALIYSVPRMKATDGLVDDVIITSKIKITPYAQRGQNRIDSFWVYPKNDIIKPYDGTISYTDELDLDGDGDTNELFVTRSAYIDYIPPLELIVTKKVGYDVDSLGLMTTIDQGREFYYGITLFNNTIAEIASAHVIDVLPYVGDHALAPNQAGDYPARGSVFPARLTRAIEDVAENAALLSRFDIYYQIEDQGADLASVRDGNWVTAASITDWSSVKSVKISLKPGQKLNSKEEITFYIPAITEIDRSLNAGTDVAVNSAAVSTDGRLYSEGNSAKINIAKYTVKGTFFKDLNDNGIIDTGEVGIGGKTVVLLDADTGNPARDNNGDIITTTTDALGNYSFDVYERGNYKVQFTKAANEEFTPVSDATNIRANNGIAVSGNDTVTNTFELSPSRSMVIRNTGIVSRVRDIEVLKISSEQAADGSDVVLSGAKFKLMAQDGTAREAISGINGKATFADVPFGTYTLSEIEAPNGYVRNANDVRTVVVNNTDALSVFTFENDPIKVNITVKKVDADDASLLLPGVTFELKDKVTGASLGTKTTDTTGKVVFENIGLGSYEIIETANADASYILPTGAAAKQDITVTQDQDIEITRTNTKKKSGVKVIKKDADTAETLSGISFALKQGGTTKYTGTTNQAGEILWNSVPYGEYTLVETATLENYVLSTVETAVSVTEDGATITKELTNTKKKGSVSVTKVDADDTNIKLQGVRFGLFKAGEAVAAYEAQTGADGVARFSDVVYGSYTLKEISTLPNYNLSTETKTVSITTDGQSVDAGTITNRLKKGKILFTKVDADTGEALAGVTFALQQGGVNKYTATSTTSGLVTFDPVVYGVYDLVEVSTLDSHNLLTSTISVNIDEDGKIINLNTITNTIKKGSVSVVKVDADDNAVKIAGVQFGLFKDNAILASYTATTGTDGVALFTGVNYGRYTLKEISTLENYNLSAETKVVNVTTNGQSIELGNFENVLKKGSVQVVKVDADDSNQKLTGVRFGLYKAADNSLAYTADTDASGVALFTGVVYGRYVLKEISTLANYNLSNETREVVIDSEGQVLNLGNFTNTLKKGSVNLVKVDADDNNIKLSGVRFGLYKTGEANPSYEAVSGSDGSVSFTNVIYGTYTLKEMSTLENYNLSTREIAIDIDAEGQVVNVGNFENTLKKGSVSLTKVDADNTAITLQGVRFGLFKAGETMPSYEAVSGADGMVNFSGVVYGRYTLKEIETLANYNLSTETREVTIATDGQEIALGNFGNTQKKGTIIVTKVDADDATKRLPGVTFGLYRAGETNPAYTAVTGTGGIASFERVTYGTYTLKEVSTLPNYNLSTREETVVVATEGQNIDIGTFTNQIKKGKVVLKKVDRDTREALVGVEFALKQGNDIKYTAVSQTDGSVTFDGVIYGEYKLVETRPLDAYNALTTETDISITTEGQEIDLDEVDNVIKRGSVRFKKVDADSGAALAGVRFGLFQNGSATAAYEAVSGADGEVLFSGVKYGRYVLKEISTLENYNLSNETREVMIDSEGQVLNLDNFTNTLKKGSVNLVKVDADDNNIKLSGVRFGLYKTGEVNPSYEAVSGSDGSVSFTNVIYGTYTLKEMSTLENYNLSTREIAIDIDAEGQVVNVGNFENTLKKGSVSLTKVDAENTAITLQGVRFGLFKAGETMPSYEAVSGADGTVNFSGVVYGRYTLKEIETLTNYNLSTETREVTIATDGQAIALGNFSNTQKKGTITVTKVDADDATQRLTGVTFGLYRAGETNPAYTAVTGTGGIASFERVTYGTYTLKEVSTLPNYNLSTREEPVVVATEGQSIDIGTFTNQIKKGKVVLKKVDRDTREALVGVEFALKQGNDIKYTAVSQTDGSVTFDGVIYGEYKLVETRPLDAYNALTQERDISITTEGQVIDLDEVDNVIKRGSVRFKKVDADSGAALAGVRFGLFQNGSAIAAYEAVSGVDGEVLFNTVDYGTYTLKEMETLPNYNLLTEERQIVIDTEGEVIDLGDVRNQIIKGAVRLQKLDADTGEALSGVVFALMQGGVEKYRAVSDNLGYVVFHGVVYGDYELVEVRALASHIPMTGSRAVSVRTEGMTIDLGEFRNTVKKGSVTLHKVDKDDTGIALAGVKFGLYKEGESVPSYEARTDVNGDLTIANIRYGRYILKEMETLEDYVLSTDTWEVNIDADGRAIALGNIKNKMIKGSVKLIKIDADTKTVLAGVTFALKQNGNIVYQATSDARGEVHFTDIPYGRYVLEEISTLESHNRLTETIEIAIDMPDKVIDLGKVENRIKKGSVTLTKVDMDDESIVLPGVRFGLYKAGANTPSYEAVSASDGIVYFSGVNYGTYILKEMETLSNYDLSTREEEVVIDEEDKRIDIGLFTNKKSTGDIYIYKKNAEGEVLAGVEFVLYKDNFIVASGVTDENGTLRFLKQELGFYRIKELNAPEGYILEDIDYKVHLSYSGQVIEQEVVNKKIKESKGGGGGGGRSGGGSVIPNSQRNENPSPNAPQLRPATPSNPETDVKIADASEDNKKPLFSLPKTGDVAGSMLLVIGIVGSMMLCLFFMLRRRRDKEDRA